MVAARREDLRRRAVHAALELAGETGWADLRMHTIADRLGVPLAELAREFRDLDAVANAWFAEVLSKTLAEPPPGFEGLPGRERLLFVMDRWFAALAPHARVSREMLRLKMHPSHPHHWVPMVFDLSRLVHWFLDAARIPGTGLRRAAQEVVLTGLFLGALGRWALPREPDAERARVYLAARLARTGFLFADGSARFRPATS